MKYLGNKLDGVDYIPRRSSYGLIFDRDGNMAVLYLSKDNMYNLPGGKIEENEDSKAALIREVREEMGYEIEAVEYLDTVGLYHFFDPKKQYFLNTSDFYTAEIGNKVSVPIEKDHELLWVQPKDIFDKMYFEHQAWVVEILLKGDKNI